MIVIIGGGPAGFFAAIRARETAPEQSVVLLEKSGQVLRKVAVSGGGRCNVTHACYEARELVTRYPRGGRELRGPFHAFGPADTTTWFADHGVELKTEPDGRMFPVSNSSGTIVDCLRDQAQKAGVEVRLGAAVRDLVRHDAGFTVQMAAGDSLAATTVLLATGGPTAAPSAARSGSELAAGLGHKISPPVPSLFTFKIDDPILAGLAGVAVPQARVKISGAKKLTETGPVLITHWGLSGPAVLRLSAWGARHLHDCGYQSEITVNWCPELSSDQIDEQLQTSTRTSGKQLISGSGPLGLPKRLWQELASAAGIPADQRWADLGRNSRQKLSNLLSNNVFYVNGQATNKEEFVTCGGVSLKEVDFKTMSSRVCPGLYLAGEILDIDGITGGFNFQSCWTTGWLAGQAMAEYCRI